MTLTPEQDRAFRAIWHWYRSGVAPRFLLAGYAGTGKTTLLQHFINQLDSEPLCAAPTGKAASVLQRRLHNARVSTLHRLLYSPLVPSTENLDILQDALMNDPNNPALLLAIEEEKKRLSEVDLKFSIKGNCELGPGRLVIVDEASMVTNRIQGDLERTGVKVLYVGDPGQLPPVNDKGFFHKTNPDVMLTQVQRQALDSAIIRLSMEVREGRYKSTFNYPNCRRVRKSEIPYPEWLTYDQVLTGKNDTRRKINRFFRRSLDHFSDKMLMPNGSYPCKGERLICLKNDQDGGFINGVICTTVSQAEHNASVGELNCSLLYEGMLLRAVPLWEYPFKVHYYPNTVEDPWVARQGLREFDYGYAITVHKSQGSEWDRVLLADDFIMSNQPEFRKRWLYTAVTRAKHELLWVNNE